MSGETQDDLVFKALADGRRREILDLLKAGPRTTGELCARFEGTLDRCTVMQHIGVLERAELIIPRREGRYRWNYLNVAPFRAIYDRWIAAYAEEAVDLLSRLKRDLEASAPEPAPSPEPQPARKKRRER
jgi:DNA-binding transcriptional ArsR family regulator